MSATTWLLGTEQRSSEKKKVLLKSYVQSIRTAHFIIHIVHDIYILYALPNSFLLFQMELIPCTIVNFTYMVCFMILQGFRVQRLLWVSEKKKILSSVEIMKAYWDYSCWNKWILHYAILTRPWGRGQGITCGCLIDSNSHRLLCLHSYSTVDYL